MEEKKEVKPIDFTMIFKAIWKHKLKYIIILPIVLIISSIFVVSIPRYYTCEVKLAPEATTNNIGGISSIASSFGIDLASKLGNSQDAISPELYPDLMSSIDFRISLFPIIIQTKDSSINENYYTYLRSHQKQSWWEKIIGNIINKFTEQATSNYNGKDKLNPFRLSKIETDIADLIGANVKCGVDKKTSVISISVKDQDPVVAATIADSVSNRLQAFITDYRTKKARNDMEYINNLYKESKVRYEKARKKYGEYGDANMDLMLESYKQEQVDLENDMQLQYNSFSTLATQYAAAKAKVQERTPVFTTLQSATVPIKPAGPKRMIIVGMILLFAFTVITLFVIQKEANK